MGPTADITHREAELEAENARLRALLEQAGIDSRRASLRHARTRADHQERLASSEKHGAELTELNERLRQSEERYQLALEAASVVGTWDWDLVQNRIYADSHFARLYSVDPASAAAGAPVSDFISGVHPDDRGWVTQAIDRVVAEGAEFAHEYRLLREDGEIRWVFARGRCFYEDGRPVRFPGVVVDITQRKRAEEKQRASERQLRDIADSLPVLIGYVDRDQRYRFNNRLYANWFGRTPEELNGLYLWDAIGADIYEQLKPRILEALAGRRVSHEWTSSLSGAAPRFLRSDYIPRRAPDGSPDGFYVLVTDLSDRKRTEEALARSEERLRIAQQAGGVGTFEWHIASGEVMVSDEFCRLWGIDPTPSVRVGLFAELVHPDDVGLLSTSGDRPLEEGIGYVEYRITRPGTRELRWLARRGQVEYGADGEPERVVGAIYDITERKQAEEQQRLLMQELAHRVKNTLTMVQAIAAQTMRNAESLDQAREAFGARLQALAKAHDVLMQGSWTNASIRQVVVGATSPHDDGRPGRFRIDGPDLSLGPKMALSLSLALHELGTNAAKYGALRTGAGRIEITWRVDDDEGEPRLRFRWEESGGPPVAPPIRRGFGSRLIERGLSADPATRISLSYPPSGVVLAFDAPLAAVQDVPEIGPGGSGER